jgi:hypothetical protein
MVGGAGCKGFDVWGEEEACPISFMSFEISARKEARGHLASIPAKPQTAAKPL